ncbi:MAG: hypothetical protein JWP52_742 [Rhizobacter sp.]|nr:hypothetical protein [Rhizobacter sp.]
MERYAKGCFDSLFLLLLDKLPDARKRAAKGLSQARAEVAMNPSTQMHELIDVLESLGSSLPIH